MATSDQIETTLAAQQADYLKSMQDAGKLPTIVNDTMNANGAPEAAALSTKEGQLLTDYTAGAANARAKFSNVWDPFARDALVANQQKLNYAPIADVRNELAMRANALGVANNATTALFNAGQEAKKTAIGFTQDAYTRAFQKEQAAKSGASKAQSTEEKTIAAFQKDLSSGLGAKIAIHGEEDQPGYVTRETLISRLQQQYPGIDPNDIKTAVYQYYAG